MNTPMTEEEIVRYLVSHTDFFHRHCDVLADIRLISPHGQRAVTLHERQLEVLRDRIKMLEHRQFDMIRYGNENTLLYEKILRWVNVLLLNTSDQNLPHLITTSLHNQFSVPQVALRLWDLAQIPASSPFSQGVTEEDRWFATSLTAPYCGMNTGFTIVKALPEPDLAASVALIPLRAPHVNHQVFGLLIFASPDEARFGSNMSVDFLNYLGDIVSNALMRLR